MDETMKYLSVSTIIFVLCLGAPIDCTLFEDIVVSVQHLVQYYASNYRHMNLDGIFGLKILEGQLSQFNSKRPQLQQLYLRARTISKLALPVLRAGNPEYFRNASLLLIPWTVWERHRSLDDRLLWPVMKATDVPILNEDVSDACLSELAKKEHNCRVSDSCFNLMLVTKRMEDFSITHQILYTHLVRMTGCMEEMNSRLKAHSYDIEHWETELCTNIMASRMEILMMYLAVVPESDQDLFMEQVLVCGMLGFTAFLDFKFARTILRWQSPSGCFADPGLTTIGTSPGRRLLKEKLLKDGCLSHKTSVALGVLSVYLHYLSETDSQTTSQTLESSQTTSLSLSVAVNTLQKQLIIEPRTLAVSPNTKMQINGPFLPKIQIEENEKLKINPQNSPHDYLAIDMLLYFILVIGVLFVSLLYLPWRRFLFQCLRQTLDRKGTPV